MYQLLLVFAVGIALTEAAVLATSIYLHRTVTHRALTRLHPAVAWMCRFILWITTGQRRQEWVAVHRKHHKYTDVPGDPHSPKLEGFWQIQLWNVIYYVRATKDKNIVAKYAGDIPEDKWDQWLFGRGRLGPMLGIAALWVLMGWWGLAAAGIHLALYVFVASSSINGLCHTLGYKNFDAPATNIRSVAVLTAGEGLHNNHHAFPRSPKFSWRPSEFDPSWAVIKPLIWLHLATPHKTIEESMAG